MAHTGFICDYVGCIGPILQELEELQRDYIGPREGSIGVPHGEYGVFKSIVPLDVAFANDT